MTSRATLQKKKSRYKSRRIADLQHWTAFFPLAFFEIFEFYSRLYYIAIAMEFHLRTNAFPRLEFFLSLDLNRDLLRLNIREKKLFSPLRRLLVQVFDFWRRPNSCEICATDHSVNKVMISSSTHRSRNLISCLFDYPLALKLCFDYAISPHEQKSSSTAKRDFKITITYIIRFLSHQLFLRTQNPITLSIKSIGFFLKIFCCCLKISPVDE